MRRCCLLVLASVLLCLPSSGVASYIEGEVAGRCDDGQRVSFHFAVRFIPFGGDFANGTGQATVTFTLSNTSPLIPFGHPDGGNPILTDFFFNVPADAVVSLVEVRILANSLLYSTGVTIYEFFIPAGIFPTAADMLQNTWYELRKGTPVKAEIGVTTSGGVQPGMVSPDVLAGAQLQGEIFAPLAIGGSIRFLLVLANLDHQLDTAGDFLRLCSRPVGSNNPIAFAGKFQAAGPTGDDGCFIDERGLCLPVATEEKTWGAIKSLYGQ